MKQEVAIMLGERRPVKSRGLVPIRWLAGFLTERGLSPNAMSLLSIVLAGIGACLMIQAGSADGMALRLFCLSAACFVQLRLLANVLDGLMAEFSGRATMTGRLLNEWPDRVSDIVLIVGFGALGQSPMALVWGMGAACAALLTAYVRELGRSVDAPPMFHGPMAKPHRMALISAALLILVVWPDLIDVPFWGPSIGWGYAEAVLLVLVIGSLITAARRLRAIHRHADTQGVKHERL